MDLLADALERKQSGGLFFIEIASALGLRERYGYAAYERLMTQAGHRLASAAQPYPLARLNDNSFLLLAVDMPEASLEQQALEIRQRLSANAFPVREEESVHVRCAIGVAPLGLGFDDTGSALEAVERTALQARLRSDGVQTYLAPSQAEQQEQLRLVEGQLELAYQPIVAVAGGDTAQYQVLLRLRQADGTLLSAGQVIPAAEAAGRIADLDQQVMDHALGLLHLYQHASPPLRLFVSQSPRTLARDAFADWLLKALVERGVAGQSLIVDLRLDDALIHAVTVQQFCAKLMPAGVRFCLSQFEPGDEANALLAQLPLSFVRMANRFADAHGNAAVRDELRGVIDIAHQRGLLIIGQRIEDPQAAAAMDERRGFHPGQPGADRRQGTGLRLHKRGALSERAGSRSSRLEHLGSAGRAGSRTRRRPAVVFAARPLARRQRGVGSAGGGLRAVCRVCRSPCRSCAARVGAAP